MLETSLSFTLLALLMPAFCCLHALLPRLLVRDPLGLIKVIVQLFPPLILIMTLTFLRTQLFLNYLIGRNFNYIKIFKDLFSVMPLYFSLTYAAFYATPFRD